MGIDCYIKKRPKYKKEEVKHWRDNWAIQCWMGSRNGTDKIITIEMLELLLEFIEDRDIECSKGWSEADWKDFEKDILNIIHDMKANEAYEYTYCGRW